MNKMILINGAFFASQAQADTLLALEGCRNGGIARVEGYRPTSEYVVVPTVNYTFLTKFSTERLYRRKIAALSGLTAAQAREVSGNVPKLAALSDADFLEAFNARRLTMVESMEKTLTGDRDDAHRAGHDRCYHTVSQGIKVNFVTEKNADGIKVPVLANGYPVAESIMLSALILSTERIVPGAKRIVNSGVPVLMGKAIDKLMNQRSVGYRSISLKADNFTAVRIDHNAIVPADVEALR